MGRFLRSATVLFATALPVAPARALEVQPALEVARETALFVERTIGHGYRVAPALMLGLMMLIAIPLVAFLSRLTNGWRRDANATRRYRRTSDTDISGEITGEEAVLASHAFVEVVGSSTRFAIFRDMLRIGREDDNDIRIPSGAVHRYHAAIHREDLGDWHITDLSGVEGNGIAVNGQRCCDARLHDGDVIDLGPGRLRFRASFA